MTAIVRQRDDIGPIQRNRSSSANEASKPIFVLQRRQTHVGAKPFSFSPSGMLSKFELTLNCTVYFTQKLSYIYVYKKRF